MSRKPRKHTKITSRPIVRVRQSGNSTPIDHAIRAIAPWEKRDYPGRRRIFLSTIPGHITWSAVQHWLSGRTPVPEWAAEALADYFEARWQADRDRAEYWRSHAKTQREKFRPPQGFMRKRVPWGPG